MVCDNQIIASLQLFPKLNDVTAHAEMQKLHYCKADYLGGSI